MPDSEDGASKMLVLFQFVAAPLGAILLGMAAAELVDAVTHTRGTPWAPWLCYPLLGFVQGCATQAVFRQAYRSGGTVTWMIPGTPLLALIVGELFNTPSTVIADFLKWNPYSLSEGSGAAFLTMPTIACCFYSLGIIAVRRYKTGQSAERNPTSYPPLRPE
ncbi:MAG TPA: hypothetical protein VK789_23175 [Bryobacteraceae bacterium]|jgi:hypothetical protein|nr:hypothetical protein [Bryobacteraceae bacterium]